MEKKEKFLAVVSLIILLIIVLLLISELNLNLTGMAIYESIPEKISDTYLREDVNTSYGESGTIRIGKASSGYERRGLIKFNLSSIPENDTITSAKISLKSIYSSTDEILKINIYRITNNWNETKATWYLKDTENWNNEGGDYNPEIVASLDLTNESKWYNITITNLIRNWVNGTYENYGLILIPNYDTSSGNYREIASSEWGNPEEILKLEVEHYENSAPTLENLTSDSSQENPKKENENIVFTIEWYDLENDASKIYICNSSNITSEGCPEKQFCFINYTETNENTCSYLVTGEEDWETDYWGIACDQFGCSNNTVQNKFYVHKEPNITLIRPIGGETINQSEGNYEIKFNITDPGNYELNSSLYYGQEKNSTDHLIISNINASEICETYETTESFSKKNCSYSWNTSGLYGEYYLTAILEDSFSSIYDSSNNSFSIVSLIDPYAPEIRSQSKDKTNISSGQEITFFAEVYDPNLKEVWISINSSGEIKNITLENYTENNFSGNWIAEEPKEYFFKVYAEDLVGNINDTLDWISLEVNKPNPILQNEIAPLTAPPYNTIRIKGEIYPLTPLKEVYAKLNISPKFYFLEDSPKNLYLGNLTENSTNEANWQVSTPFEEGTYPLKIIYTDKYGNEWNSSEKEIEITTSASDFLLSYSDYSLVATGERYSGFSSFTKDNQYVQADEMKISLYDALGNLMVNSIDMEETETGKYNYSYDLHSSVVEGQWKTIVNATKDSESYYKTTFWRVIGGPFDVRDINILDNKIEELEIEVTTENTGDKNRDLVLEWNLTREDNGQQLDAGAETFMVPANSIRNWTINPLTSYLGKTRITFVGQWGSPEKAGAYKIFDTEKSEDEDEDEKPPSSGGGGGSSTDPIEKEINWDIRLERIIHVVKNSEKTTFFEIENTGTESLENLNLEIQGLEKENYLLVSDKIKKMSPEDKNSFEIIFFGKEIGEKEFNYFLTSSKINETYSAKIITTNLKEYLLNLLEELEKDYNLLKEKLEKRKELDLLKDLESCKENIDNANESIEINKLDKAEKEIENGRKCIEDINTKLDKLSDITEKEEKDMGRIIWTILGMIFLILIAIIILILYKLYNKFSLMSFFKKEGNLAKNNQKEKSPQIDLDKKIEEIKKKLN